MEQVVLVDAAGVETGRSEKLAAHRPPGSLHRAISVFVRNPDGGLLLQRRAPGKYHFTGRWGNACCSHPRPGESPADAAARRLEEEMGLRLPLSPVGAFTYRAEDPVGGLVEHEYDHVYLGRTDGDPVPDPDECDAWEWVTPEALRRRIDRQDPTLAPWLVIAVRAFPVLID